MASTTKKSAVPAVAHKSTEEDRNRAKQLFFSYASTAAIAKEMGVSQATVVKWRDENDWETARKNADRELIDDTFSVKRVSLARITKVTTEQIERGLKVIADRFEAPSLKEMESLTNILANLDKISRLDSGKATEHVSIGVQGTLDLTVDKIKEMIMNEPFFPKKDEPAPPVASDA
jgi:predicted transcriptional regulator